MRLSEQFFFFFYKYILHKKTHKLLFKYLNTPKKHNKAPKQLSFRHYA